MKIIGVDIDNNYYVDRNDLVHCQMHKVNDDEYHVNRYFRIFVKIGFKVLSNI